MRNRVIYVTSEHRINSIMTRVVHLVLLIEYEQFKTIKHFVGIIKTTQMHMNIEDHSSAACFREINLKCEYFTFENLLC